MRLRYAIAVGVPLFLFLAACEVTTASRQVDITMIKASRPTLFVGERRQLTASALDDRGFHIGRTPAQWSSSDPAIARISSSGMLTGVAPGQVTIMAVIEGKRDTRAFTVLNPYGDCPLTVHPGPFATTGTLSATDCRLGDETLIDLHQFTISSAREVTISMASNAFDSYLFLLSHDSRTLLGEDNDSGGNRNARLTIRLAAGTYVVVANSLVPATGAYTLTAQ